MEEKTTATGKLKNLDLYPRKIDKPSREERIFTQCKTSNEVQEH